MPTPITTALFLLKRAERQMNILQRTLQQIDLLRLPIYWSLPAELFRHVKYITCQLQDSKQQLVEICPLKSKTHKNNGGKKGKQKAEDGNRTHNLRFTKPLLCQLSYLSICHIVAFFQRDANRVVSG